MAITVYGPDYSTYVRSVRLALEEKGAAYRLEPVDILAGRHQEPGHLARQPFGPVPALEHDGFALYETSAIVRYIDEALPGPKLAPADVRARARMNQIAAIIDSYAYRAIIQGLFWQRAVVPMTGGTADEAIVTGCLPRVRLCLAEIERLMGAGPWLAGDAVSLADLMVAPVLSHLQMVPEAAPLMGERPALARWWQAMAARPSMVATVPRFG